MVWKREKKPWSDRMRSKKQNTLGNTEACCAQVFCVQTKLNVYGALAEVKFDPCLVQGVIVCIISTSLQMHLFSMHKSSSPSSLSFCYTHSAHWFYYGVYEHFFVFYPLCFLCFGFRTLRTGLWLQTCIYKYSRHVYMWVCVCMLICSISNHQVQAAVTGSSTLYVWWGWAGLWTDCDTVYTRRWCPPPSAACVSTGWCLQENKSRAYLQWFQGKL